MGSRPTLDQQELADEALELDHRNWIHDHQRMAERTAEEAFDRLNPTLGVPADRSHPIGHHDVVQREAALALGIRVAVHDSRQNDRNPVIWQPGQDYRMADALHAARTQPHPRPAWPRAGQPQTLNQHEQGETAPWQRTTTPPSSATSSRTLSSGSPETASR